MTISLKTAEGVLVLTSIKGLGPAGISKILNKFETLDDLCAADDSDHKGVINKTISTYLRNPLNVQDSINEAHQEMRRADRAGVSILVQSDDFYPALLKGVPDSPLILYGKGEFQSVSRSVAVVGMVNPSKYGASVTTKVVDAISSFGMGVSGTLAGGIPSLSLEYALNNTDAKCYAVIGSGFNRTNGEDPWHLLDRVVERGAVFSEQFMDLPGDAGKAIRRNRLHVGISAGVIVPQCNLEPNSYSLHAIRYALYQGKKLYAPFPPDKWIEEEENQGVVSLSTYNGSSLIEKFPIKESLQEILERDYGNIPAITPFRGRDEYPEIFKIFEEYCSQSSFYPPAETGDEEFNYALL